MIAIDTLQAIRGRRSIRCFKRDPIPIEVLEEVIDAGRWAPYGTAHDSRVLRVMAGAEKAGLVDFLARRLEEAGELQLQREEIAVEEVTAQALERVRYLAQEKKQRLETAIPSDLTLYGDFELIKRVLVNLLSNAVKFTPEGGRISVEGGRQNGAVRICVRDTGVGIPEDQLDRLFDKFAQVEPADGRRRQGTGLGLAFVKLAVEAHGGTVTVESTVGKGSTFCFTIPDRSAETAGDTK